MKIVFFGSDAWSIHVLKALEENYDVKAAVCAPDSPVQVHAQKHNIPVFTPVKLDQNFNSQLSILNCQLFIVASFGKIIPKSILSIPEFGALNIHPSLLPIYRGPSPVQAAILNGDKETGITIIKMDEEMDHGPIIYTNKIKLSGQEDFPILINKLFQLGGDIIVNIIPDFIAGKIKSVEQDHTLANYCPLLTKESGYFSIENPPSSDQLDRMIRAYHPWPGVWTKWNNKIVKFLPVKKLQMEGKKPLALKDFINGYPNFPLKI